MHEKASENSQKKREKIFKNLAKPYATALLPIAVVDALLGASGYLTITEIQQAIAASEAGHYSKGAIMNAVNNIHLHCRHVELYIQKVRAGKSRAFSFLLKLKQ